MTIFFISYANRCHRHTIFHGLCLVFAKYFTFPFDLCLFVRVFFRGGGGIKNCIRRRHMFTSHQTNDKYANIKLCKSLYILTSSNPICRNIYQQIERCIYSENTLSSEFQNNAIFFMGSETIKFILHVRVRTDFSA